MKVNKHASTLELKPAHKVPAPAEIWGQIFAYLSDDSQTIHNIRHTCHFFRDAAWPAFGDSFNHKLFHPLCRASVEALEALSKRDNAASYIHHLNLTSASFSLEGFKAFKTFIDSRTIFCPACPMLMQPHMTTMVPAMVSAAQQMDCATNSMLFHTYNKEMSWYLLPPNVSEMEGRFYHAISRLRKVRTVVILGPEDLGKACRFRGLNLSRGWILKDWSELKRSLGDASNSGCRVYNDSSLRGGDNANDSQRQMYGPAQRRLLRMLVHSGIGNRLLKLKITDMTALTALQVPFLIEQAAIQSFSCLRTLILRLEAPERLELAQKNVTCLSAVPNFLQCIGKALETLSIIFPVYEEHEIPTVPGRTLFGNEGFQGIAFGNFYFPQLRRLSLENLHISGRMMLEHFLHRHRESLTSLELIQVTFGSGHHHRALLGWMEKNLHLEKLAVASYTTPRLLQLQAEFCPTKAEYDGAAKKVVPGRPFILKKDDNDDE